MTLAHPHGQIYGYPFATPKTAAADPFDAAVPRAAPAATCSADLLAGEIADGSRIVAENEHWVAFVPFAARWPVEVHLYPRSRVRDLTELGDAEPGRAGRAVPGRDQADGGHVRRQPAGDHRRPPGARARPTAQDFWLHLEVLTIRRAAGKIKYLAGSESAMGAFVNDINPEIAAQRLRDVAAQRLREVAAARPGDTGSVTR